MSCAHQVDERHSDLIRVFDLMRDQLEGLEIQPDEHAWDERDDDRKEEDEAKKRRVRVDVGERVLRREEQRRGLQDAAWARGCVGAR